MTKTMSMYYVFFLLCLVALSACDDNFARFNEIEGLRVLGVQAEPPTLRPGQTSVLQALVYLEEGDRADLRYAWSLCPFVDPTDPSRCLQDEAGFAADFGIDPDTLSFDLGTASTASLEYQSGSAALLARLCENATAGAGELGGFLFDCEGGFPMQVFVTVRHGDQKVVAVKQVRFALNDATQGNANPRLLDRVLIAERENDDGDPPRSEAVLLEDGDSVVLGESYRLFLEVEDGAEMFLDRDEAADGALRERLENLYVTWFVSSGETEYARTSQVEDVERPLPLEENNWDLPLAGDEDADEAQLFFVLRDERGGSAWIARRVELVR